MPGNAAAVQLLQEELDSKEPESINFEEEVEFFYLIIEWKFFVYVQIVPPTYIL